MLEDENFVLPNIQYKIRNPLVTYVPMFSGYPTNLPLPCDGSIEGAPIPLRQSESNNR